VTTGDAAFLAATLAIVGVNTVTTAYMTQVTPTLEKTTGATAFEIGVQHVPTGTKIVVKALTIATDAVQTVETAVV
jgi:hypothetical protein